jgi:hypothetical protein
MTKNGTALVFLLLLTLATGLAISNYLWKLREDIRRAEQRLARRTDRGRLAA